MPRCNHEDCNLTNRLSTLIFYDPQNILTEQTFLCQAHSDRIIAKFMQEYENEISIINFLNHRRKEEDKRRDFYDQSNSKTFETIQDHYRRKNKISNYSCRSLTCKNEITKKQLRYSVFVIHANGNFRHYFYFCCLKCVNQMRALSGLNVPILEKQLTIN